MDYGGVVGCGEVGGGWRGWFLWREGGGLEVCCGGGGGEGCGGERL